ncbi:MAG: ribosome maturation factor RimP [Actinomycetales bacterium]
MAGAVSEGQVDQVRALLEPAVVPLGVDLEDVVITSAGKRRLVRVVVDRDGGVPLDTVADVSTAVSGALDATDALGDAPYVLEVTSPGVDRPLTEPRHWRRNVGRLVRVSVTATPGTGAPTNVVARILAVDDGGVTFEPQPDDSARKPGQKPSKRQLAMATAALAGADDAPAADGSVHVPWGRLGEGKVQIEFGRPDSDDESVDEESVDGYSGDDSDDESADDYSDDELDQDEEAEV